MYMQSGATTRAIMYMQPMCIQSCTCNLCAFHHSHAIMLMKSCACNHARAIMLMQSCTCNHVRAIMRMQSRACNHAHAIICVLSRHKPHAPVQKSAAFQECVAQRTPMRPCASRKCCSSPASSTATRPGWVGLGFCFRVDRVDVVGFEPSANPVTLACAACR